MPPAVTSVSVVNAADQDVARPAARPGQGAVAVQVAELVGEQKTSPQLSQPSGSIP